MKSIARPKVIQPTSPSRVDINGGLPNKLTAICWLFEAMNTDVLVLTDTRLIESETELITRQAQKLLPLGTQYRHAPISTGRGTRIGGQLIIVSQRWSGSIMNFWKDESPFGLVTSLTLRCAHQDIQIIGSYWP